MVIEKRMKVPNGKLLILKAEIQDGKIVKVHIQETSFSILKTNLLCLKMHYPNQLAGTRKPTSSMW